MGCSQSKGRARFSGPEPLGTGDPGWRVEGGTVCVCPSREGRGSVPQCWSPLRILSVPLGVCVSVHCLMFYLSVPVEGLGESSFVWVCASG